MVSVGRFDGTVPKEVGITASGAEKSVEDFGGEMKEVAASVEVADAMLVACRADLATITELVHVSPMAPRASPEKEVGGVAPSVDAEVVSVRKLDAVAVTEMAPVEVADAEAAPTADVDTASASAPCSA